MHHSPRPEPHTSSAPRRAFAATGGPTTANNRTIPLFAAVGFRNIRCLAVPSELIVFVSVCTKLLGLSCLQRGQHGSVQESHSNSNLEFQAPRHA